jgi:hypothetical protein
MQKDIDSKIQARARILLARRWVDLRTVTIGTTNGVVYIGGSLRTSGGPGSELPGAFPGRPAGWLGRLRRELEEIPEVRDVVFQLQDGEEADLEWREHSA